QPTEALDIKARVELFNKELTALLQKYHLKMEGGMDFPQYKILPTELQLAILLIQQHRGQYLMNLIDLLAPPVPTGKEIEDANA
ncbi:MAG: hypothetical protein KGI08_10075, partial [Thaumarchaeota archaeon]|nr:hypothetical protein [Nitrososphaerota archaeon]